MSEVLVIREWRGVRTEGDTAPHLLEAGERQDARNVWARTGALRTRPGTQTMRLFASPNEYLTPIALFHIAVETDDDTVDDTIHGRAVTDRLRNTGVGVQLDDSGDGLPVQLPEPS